VTAPATIALPRSWLIGGALGLIGVAVAATTLLVRSPASGGAAPAASPTVAAATPATAAAPTKGPAQGAAVASPRNTATTVAKAPAASTAPTPLATQPASERREVPAACPDCGFVESVQAVQRKGEGTGLGAVAGGVVGGVLGNQMGGGSGRDAMTVIGAVGGGVAGHEIEKRVRSKTEYEVRVRLADGTRRTLTQARSFEVGQPVRVEGGRIVPLEAAARAEPPAARPMTTATRS
jgi:outer membrane lipoprotein SlyB